MSLNVSAEVEARIVAKAQEAGVFHVRPLRIRWGETRPAFERAAVAVGRQLRLELVWNAWRPQSLEPATIKRGEIAMIAALDWSQCPAVESVPGRCSGAWVLRETRMPVSVIFENLEYGSTIEEIIENYRVTREQIQEVLDFVARSAARRSSSPCAAPCSSGCGREERWQLFAL